MFYTYGLAILAISGNGKNDDFSRVSRTFSACVKLKDLFFVGSHLELPLFSLRDPRVWLPEATFL